MTKEEMIKLFSTPDHGYRDVREKADAGLIGIMPLVFTLAIVSGMNDTGYDNRWCYRCSIAAGAALDTWDGAEGTEPKSRHRHPSSGRRIDEHGNETINF
jgi:hypothetical protein